MIADAVQRGVLRPAVLFNSQTDTTYTQTQDLITSGRAALWLGRAGSTAGDTFSSDGMEQAVPW